MKSLIKRKWARHKTRSKSALNTCHRQVWDKSENGEWLCTASWKVNHLMLLDPFLTWTGFPGKTLYQPVCLHNVIIHYITFSIFITWNGNEDPSYNLQVWPKLFFCADTQRVGLEGDLGPSRIRAGSGLLLLWQDRCCLGRDRGRVQWQTERTKPLGSWHLNPGDYSFYNCLITVYRSVCLSLSHICHFLFVFRSREPRWWTAVPQWLTWSLPPSIWAWCLPPALRMEWWGSTKLRM